MRYTKRKSVRGTEEKYRGQKRKRVMDERSKKKKQDRN